MECPVCYREWDSQQVIPRNLPCGHSYCEEDLFKLYTPIAGENGADQAGGGGQITCPTCCLEHKFKSKADIH